MSEEMQMKFFDRRRAWLEVVVVPAISGNDSYDVVLRLDGSYSSAGDAAEVAASMVEQLREAGVQAKLGRSDR